MVTMAGGVARVIGDGFSMQRAPARSCIHAVIA